jgi:23S rRNA (guanosine2251-2'-O)-methyltransferase
MPDYAEGRRSVQEALSAGRQLDTLYVLNTSHFADLVAQAHTAGARVIFCDRKRLDGISQTQHHQGVIGSFAAREYGSIEQILEVAQQRGEAPLIVVCDGVEDEGNLGAILRSAEAAGAHGVIIPKSRSASLSAVVLRASAGAAEHLCIAKVPGIPLALRELKEKGLWLYGGDMEGTSSVFETDFSSPCAIVVGSEGKGLSRLVREECDFLVSIPMKGHINSLNVSAATAVLLFQTVRSRQSVSQQKEGSV